MPPTTARGAGARAVVGIDIGGTGTRFVATDPATHEVLARLTVATPASGTPQDIEIFLNHQIDTVGGGHRPLAVGVGASGPIDTDGIIRNPDTLPAFTGLSLLDMLHRVTDGPVAIDNDAVCAALAERAVGAAQHTTRSLHLTLGTGVGVCLLDHQRPFRRADNTHPEGGHISVAVPTADCYCGRPACWEQAASRQTLQRAAARIANRPPTDPTVIAEVAARAVQGDLAARACFDAYGLGIADGLGTLLALYGASLVVIGGSAANYFSLCRPIVEAALGKLNGWIPPHQIVTTQLDDYGGAIGGALLVGPGRS
jgi:glucokinase